MSNVLVIADDQHPFVHKDYIKFLKAVARKYDIDEVVQETVFAVVKGFKDFQRQGEGSFRAWLKTIARNCWKRVAANRQRALGLSGAAISAQGVVGLADNPLAENHLMQLFDEWATRELLELAYDRVRHRVNEQTWQTYSLTTFDHLTVEQTAARLDLGVRQVYDAVFRVRRLIRQEMASLDK